MYTKLCVDCFYSTKFRDQGVLCEVGLHCVFPPPHLCTCLSSGCFSSKIEVHIFVVVDCPHLLQEIPVHISAKKTAVHTERTRREGESERKQFFRD